MSDLLVETFGGPHHTGKDQFRILTASPRVTDIPSDIPHPSIFSSLSDARDAELPTASQCAVHLELLEVFFKLRAQVINSEPLNATFGVAGNNKIVYRRRWSTRDRKYVREQHKVKDEAWDARRREKWRYFLEIAAGRFLSWAKTMDSKVAIPRSSFEIQRQTAVILPHLPPLDVLLIWHAFLMNPRSYRQYCQTNSLNFLPLILFPWERIHSAIDSLRLDYKLPTGDEVWLKEMARLEPDLFDYLVYLGESKSGVASILSHKDEEITAFLPTTLQLRSLKHLPRQERAFVNTLELMVTQKDLTTSLVENAQRQGKFVEKMHAQLWIRSPGLSGTVRRASQRYENFIELLKLHPDTVLAPTLDIDLAWYSHQLSAQSYVDAMKSRCERFIDHNDKLGKTTQDMSRTAELYALHFRDEYSICTCWECEMVATALESFPASDDLELADTESLAERVKKEVESFRLYEMARRSYLFPETTRPDVWGKTDWTHAQLTHPSPTSRVAIVIARLLILRLLWMEASTRKRRFTSRSRSGCLSCRHHHRKCDEERPVCGECRRHSRPCEYGLRIAWGGRPFQKSSFGKCISNKSVEAFQAESPSSFVYGPGSSGEVATNSAQSAQLSQDLHQQNQHSIDTSSLTSSPQCTALSIPEALSSLPDLSPPYKQLLHHFTHVATSFSCDDRIKHSFNATFIPMAVTTSHVLTAVLNLAAAHKLNTESPETAQHRAHLQVIAIKQLRLKVLSNQGASIETIISATILLCYSEIVMGKDKSHSWRLHLEGAASLLSNDSSTWGIRCEDPTRAFISRCFVSLVALANISKNPPSELASSQAVRMANENRQAESIDEFTAYSTDLVQIFVDIGGLLRRQDEMLDGYPGESQMQIQNLVGKLELLIQNASNQLQTLVSPSSKEAEYWSINLAYHHAALLQVNQRLRRMHAACTEVQHSVVQILGLLAGTEFIRDPCPAIVLLFPLFSAGCGAINPHHRHQVRTMLATMLDLFRIKAVDHSIRVLEALWYHQDIYTGPQYLAWESFVGERLPIRC